MTKTYIPTYKHIQAEPGETSSFVLFTETVAQGYGYERGRRVAVQDTKGDSKESLEAIRTEALSKGKQCQPYQGADEKVGESVSRYVAEHVCMYVG